MLRDDLQRLKCSVEGRTVFILGGGPSVTPDILSIINENRIKTFALNSSVKFINNPIGLLWCDDSWANNNEKTVRELDCPKFYVKMHARTYIKNNIKGFCGSTVLNKTGDYGFDKDINNVRGNNSGANAINLLVNCGARVIGLLGFDMNTERGKAHFHNDYTYAIIPSVYSDLFIPSIVSMNDYIKSTGCSVRIYNCNENSALRCFEYKNFKDML